MAALLLLGNLLPAAAWAEGPPAPYLWVADAPFTRNPTVHLAIVHGDYDAVDRRLVSHSPTLNGGTLAHGVEFPAAGDWTLAAGPDGPRTIYGQVLYKDGSKSAVMSLPMHLDTSAPSALYVDLDSHGHSAPVSLPVGAKWRERISSENRRFTGHVIPAPVGGGPDPSGFRVLAGEWGDWGVFFRRTDVSPTVGTFQVSPEGPIFAGVQGRYSSSCHGTGTFTIHQLQFHGNGDLARVDAEFRLLCGQAVMAGSVQYGAQRQVTAVRQSAEQVLLGEANVGEQSATQSVSLINFGDLPAQLGKAELGGVNPGDFRITADGCSGTVLAVNQTCMVSLRFLPTERGNRFATLTIADPTLRGSRLIRLGGSAWQPTTLQLVAKTLPPNPGQATFEVIISPPVGTMGPGLLFNGEQKYGPTVTELSNPPRQVLTYTFPVPPGDHTVTASYWGQDFFLPSEATPIHFSVGPYTEPPMVQLDHLSLVPGTAVQSGKVTVRLGWTTARPAARFELQRRVGTKPWKVVSTNLTTNQLDLRLAAGKSHTFRIRAFDEQGKASLWTERVPAPLLGIQEGSTRITYTGKWTTARNTSFWAGAARHAKGSAASAQMWSDGLSVAWVARTGPKRGKAQIIIDGAIVATVDLYSPTVGLRRVVWVGSWDSYWRKSFTVVVAGTAGRPRVDLDAFVTLGERP